MYARHCFLQKSGDSSLKGFLRITFKTLFHPATQTPEELHQDEMYLIVVRNLCKLNILYLPANNSYSDIDSSGEILYINLIR